MSTPISETMTWAVRSAIPGMVHKARICAAKGSVITSIWPSRRAIVASRWSIMSRCSRARTAWWSANRPANAIDRSGIFLRITPRARSASTRGSRCPPIRASIMSRADLVVRVEATESIFTPASSRTLAQPLQLTGAGLDELLAVAGDLPDRGDLLGRDEAASQQPDLQQLRQPLAVLHIALAARDVLHVRSVDQQHLDTLTPTPGLRLAQGMEHRPPIHPGGLHHHVGDALLGQPGRHHRQHRVEGLEPPGHLHPPRPRTSTTIAGNPDRDRDLPLTDIDPSHPRKDDLHAVTRLRHRHAGASPREPARSRH